MKNKTVEELFLNKWTVTRGNLPGVTCGRVVGISVNETTGLYNVTMEEASRIHAWSNTACTLGLAFSGPGEGSRCTEMTEVCSVADINEVTIMSPKAVRTLKAIKKWTFEGSEDDS